MQDISFVIGGKAGDGVMRAAELLGKMFNRLGLYAFVINDYQSLIRGGHNFCKVRACSRQVYTHRESIELNAAIDQETITKHDSELSKGGRVLYDSDVCKYEGPHEGLPIPLTSMVKEVGGTTIMKNSAMISAMAYLYDVPLELVNDVISQAYGGKVGKNIDLVRMGRDYAAKNFEPILKVEPVKREPTPFISGAETVALGAVKAGMKLFITYPMTPASSVLNYVGPKQDELGVVLVHPENEIGVANMMLGSAYAGVRTMAATAGGGFALMQEAFSMAGQAEIPAVFLVGQRVAPAVGVPTYTAQGDLRFALHAGHGEFPRIVVAPGDPNEAFVTMGEAMNLAWKYQVQAIVLVDKHLLESYMSIGIDEENVGVEPDSVARSWQGEYRRYRFTDSGVSPMALPGTPGAIVKATSYEHDEFGYAEESAAGIEKMQEKRLRKMQAIKQDLLGRETVKVYGDTKSDNVVVAWGSTKGSILEAMALAQKPLKFLQVLYLSPFPTDEVSGHLGTASKSLIVEGNLTGQLRSLIREHTGYRIENAELKNDGRPFDPPSLAKRFGEVFGWR